MVWMSRVVDSTSPLLQTWIQNKTQSTPPWSSILLFYHIHTLTFWVTVQQSRREEIFVAESHCKNERYLSGRKACGSSHTSSIVCSRRVGMMIFIPLGISSPFTLVDWVQVLTVLWSIRSWNTMTCSRTQVPCSWRKHSQCLINDHIQIRNVLYNSGYGSTLQGVVLHNKIDTTHQFSYLRFK